MKHLLLRTVAGTGLMLFGLTASMQAQRPRDDDSYHRDRDDYFRGDQWRARMFDRVRDDLNHVQTTWFTGGGDQYRIDKAKQELNELQTAMAEHRFNERALDEVVNAMQRVVSDSRLSDRDRSILNDDLARLRQFRERHDEWGAR
jgi:hypothetical protein